MDENYYLLTVHYSASSGQGHINIYYSCIDFNLRDCIDYCSKRIGEIFNYKVSGLVVISRFRVTIKEYKLNVGV